jgi:hypothetical protein
MKIDENALNQLREICSDLTGQVFSDVELQQIGERIIRFLLNTEGASGPPEQVVSK